MFRNIECPSCGRTNRVNNIENYFGKKARIYCLNTSCGKPIIIDLTREVSSDDKTVLVGRLELNVNTNAFLNYETQNGEVVKYKLLPLDNVIGRGQTPGNQADLIIDEDPYISRRQFKIKAKDNNYTIVDCNSKNVTLLNNHPLNSGEEIYLHDGDIIIAGRTKFVFSLEG